MADEQKPRIIFVTPSKKADAQDRPSPLKLKRVPLRSEAALQQLALQIAANAGLMERFRLAFGSNDKALTARVMNEVREYAQTLDSTVTFSEGTRLALLLTNMVAAEKDMNRARP